MKDDEIRETLLLDTRSDRTSSERSGKEDRAWRSVLPSRSSSPGSPPLDLEAAVKRACDMGMRSLVVYPPQSGEPQLSREEHEALANLALTSSCRRGMEPAASIVAGTAAERAPPCARVVVALS